MPPVVAAVAVFAAGNVAGGAALTIFGSSILAQAAAGAVIGAAVGAGTAAVMGQDIKKGALSGALSGAVVGGGIAASRGAALIGSGTKAGASSTVVATNEGAALVGGGQNGMSMAPNIAKDGVLGMSTGPGGAYNPAAAAQTGMAAAAPSSEMSMSQALLEMKKLDQANAMTQMKMAGLSKGAEALMAPDPEDEERRKLETAIALDNSRKIGGLDQVTRNIAQGQITAPEANSWQARLEQLKKGGLLA